jgi:hypothetical protein
MVAFAYEYAVLGERLFREKNFSATFAEAIDRFWPGAAEAWSALEALNGLNDEPVLRSPSADTPLLRCANTTVQWPLRGPLRVMGASGGKVPDPKRTPSGSAERLPPHAAPVRLRVRSTRIGFVSLKLSVEGRFDVLCVDRRGWQVGHHEPVAMRTPRPTARSKSQLLPPSIDLAPVV